MLTFSQRILFVGFGGRRAVHAAHPAAPYQRRSEAHHHHGVRAGRSGAEALARTGRHLRQEPRRAGQHGRAPRRTSLCRRSPHRPGLEHRLRRDRAVVPRPGRAVHQHVGGALGPVRRGGQQASDRADALLAPHEPAADDRRHGRSPARRRCSSTGPTRA